MTLHCVHAYAYVQAYAVPSCAASKETMMLAALSNGELMVTITVILLKGNGWLITLTTD